MMPVTRAWKRPARPRRAFAWSLQSLVALALIAGCAAAPHPPASIPAPTHPTGPGALPPATAAAETTAHPPPAGYDGLRDSLQTVDTHGLVGRRIALDPGHGGFFPGAIGPTGLTEAEVNLGVALALRNRLTAAGAQVFMTRERDRDFLTPRDSSLKADLAERSRLANAWGADLFLSIHHNADAGGRHDVNETQTFYQLGDDGRSLDAGVDVLRSLARNVGIGPGRVIPGNYFVVRSSDPPALLTETSYLTYPPTETRLRDPAAQHIEADALFIGLARFFARPAPEIASFVARADVASAADTVFDVATPMFEARIAGACDAVALTLDGEPLATERAGGIVRAWPARALPGGEHVAVLRARLGGGGTARTRTLRFRIERPVAALRLSARPGDQPPAGGWVGLRVELLDSFGLPATDTALVRVSAVCRSDLLANGLVRARDGVAWAYAKLASATERARRGDACERASFHVTLVPGSGSTRARGGAGVASVTLDVPDDPTRVPATGFVVAMPGDTALRVAPGTAEPATAIHWLDRDGFACLDRDTAGRIVTPRLPGWRPWAVDSSGDDFPGRWSPIAGGALIGKRITLDPDGGGDDVAGLGPLGTRGSRLALSEARILAGFLTAAGAEVALTREGDDDPTDVERVQASESFRSDRFVRLSHRPRSPWVGYYYASPAGKTWARRSVEDLARLGCAEAVFGEDAAFVVRQVSCTALLVDASPLADSLAETRITAPGALRAEAFALFVALARDLGNGAEFGRDSLRVTDAQGAPVAGAFVTLGDALVLESGADGWVHFARTESGPIVAEVRDRRVNARRVLLDSMRGAILAGPGGR